jgi:dTMP kinase
MTKLSFFEHSGSPNRGLFISVDGPSGVGKTTLIGHLAGLLTAAGHDVHMTAEPSAGPIGALCREVTDTISGHALACLYTADSSAKEVRFYAEAAEHLTQAGFAVLRIDCTRRTPLEGAMAIREYLGV